MQKSLRKLSLFLSVVLLAGACGSGGSSSSGAAGSSGGGTMGAAGTTGAGGSVPGNATFTVDVSLSTTIPTVGIVTWSIDQSIDRATIDFGRDPSNFEYHAPVELTPPSHRTLLLGMKQNTGYQLRITAQGGGKIYVSDLYPVMTGALARDLPVFTVTDSNRSGLYADGGFTVSCTGLSGGIGIGGTGGKSWAFIFDKDGDVVWAYDFTNTVAKQCSRARMSWDGHFMWAGNFANVSTMGALTRIGMDGTTVPSPHDYALPGRSHDFSTMPNGHILFFQQDNGGGYTNGKEGPDSIMELNPDTSMTTKLYDETANFSPLIDSTQGAHTNFARFVPELNAISFSMRHISTIGLISYPAGQLLATFGGGQTDFSAMSWSFQHGHEVRSDHIWVFNNSGSNGGADVLGFTYNLAGKTATQTLRYSSGVSSPAFGDVAELPNGNLWVTYSTSATFHEVSTSAMAGTLLRKITTTTTVGYSEHRGTLYGPPPPSGT